VILLDTHVLVWTVAEPRRLSAKAASMIRRAMKSGGVGIASITLWELAWLFARGRLRHRGTVESALDEIVEAARARVFPMTTGVAAHGAQYGEQFSGDPADRVIVATAQVEGLRLLSADERILASGVGVDVVW
jgi:PIN domain nuclease of toxin-antitoxin system